MRVRPAEQEWAWLLAVARSNVAAQEDTLGDWRDPALLRSLSRVAQTIRLLDGEQKTQDLTAPVRR